MWQNVAVVESMGWVLGGSGVVLFFQPSACLEFFIIQCGSVTLPEGEPWVNRKLSVKIAGSAEMVKTVNTIRGLPWVPGTIAAASSPLFMLSPRRGPPPQTR